MDNFSFQLVSDRYLEQALVLAFGGKKTTTWWSATPQVLCLFWHDPNDDIKSSKVNATVAYPYPVPLTPQQVLPLVEAWLKSAKYPTEGSSIGDNGSVGKGFKISTRYEDDPHSHFCPYYICKIEPAWAIYHK